MKIGIHGHYWLLPLFTFAVWITNIVGLLGLWAHQNFRRYEVEEASVVFISDVGAANHTFFIIFSCLTAAGYILTTLAERHLRHKRRIPGSVRRRQTIYDILSVVFAVIGAIGLILLSVFDAFNHSTVHWSMTVVFVVFTALSVLFQVLQVFSLAQDYYGLKTMKLVAVLKAIILTLAIAGAIAFVALYATCRGNAFPGDSRCDKVVSAAAVCEWAIAFLLSLFYLTYIVDLWPAHRRAQLGLSEDGTMVENKQLAHEHGTDVGRPAAPYAIDGRADYDNTHYPSAAATEMRHQQQANVGVPAASAAPVAGTGHSPTMTNATMPNSERGSLYQPAMVEAPHQPRY